LKCALKIIKANITAMPRIKFHPKVLQD